MWLRTLLILLMLGALLNWYFSWMRNPAFYSLCKQITPALNEFIGIFVVDWGRSECYAMGTYNL